jgi:hypothetical protein
MSPERTTLPSYSRVFRPERRIHQIDGHRLPVPGGVPLAVVGYAALGLIAIILLGQLPPIGALLGLLHPALRYLGLPVAAAVVLWQVRPDGRSAPAALFSWIRWRVSRRRRRPPAHRVRLRLDKRAP